MLETYDKKGRKIFIWVIIAVIVATSFFLIFNQYFAFNSEINKMEKTLSEANVKAIQQVTKEQKTYNGQIEYIEGDVEKRSGSNSGWFSANKSDVVQSGDEVRTLAKSRAIITIEDGSVVRLNENTHIIFDGQDDNITVTMDKGFVYNNVAKNNDRVYTVKTGNYKIEALGTEFSVENDSESIDVMVVESAVHVSSDKQDVKETVKEGNKVKVTENKIEKEVITNKDLEDEFIVWSTEDKTKKDDNVDNEKNKDKKNEEKEQTKTEAKGVIKLSGEKSSSGVRLHWEVSGVNTNKGFKVVKSKEINPVYPGDDYKYLSDSGVRDYKWKIDNGKKYHFRVCAYLGDGKCGVYSNDIEVRAPEGDDKDDKKNEDDGYATSVLLKAEADGDEVKLKWEISGGDAPKGFKVVKSKEKNPKYPGDDYKYLSDGDKRKYTWENLKEGKTYHFRVCIYQGGKCGAYSNDVKVEL